MLKISLSRMMSTYATTKTHPSMITTLGTMQVERAFHNHIMDLAAIMAIIVLITEQAKEHATIAKRNADGQIIVGTGKEEKRPVVDERNMQTLSNQPRRMTMMMWANKPLWCLKPDGAAAMKSSQGNATQNS